MPDYIPRTDDALLTWFNNFAAKFAAYSGALGFNDNDVDNVNANAAMVQTLLNRVETFKQEAQEAVAYKNLMLRKPLGTPAPAPPINPNPVFPVTVMSPGILARTRALAARIKASPTYSEAIGKDLGIIGASDNAGPNPAAKPVLSAVTAGADTVDVSFVKNGYQGVLLESQRGTETVWTQIANLRYSPYRDFRPNLAEGVPDVRRYRAIYLVKDKSTGQYSDTVTITVL